MMYNTVIDFKEVIMTPFKDEIAKNLLYYRKKAGLTQKQLAEMLGVKSSSVSNWETGLNSIDIENLINACNIFGITLNDVYGKYTHEGLTEHETLLVNAYRSNPSMQPAVNKLLGIEDAEEPVRHEPVISDDVAETVKNLDRAAQDSKSLYKK